jgi:hypothetical protein
MKLHIENSAIWYPDCENATPLNTVLSDEVIPESVWPKLAFVPPMQRRRLSPFAKIALYAAHQASVNNEEDLPMIFSSRHGDLHKTSDLLGELALDNELSPTAFSLSVHNAVAGLYSILTHNKSAINAMAAGQDSVFMALVDAYARLKSGICNKVLLVHVDQALPHTYDEFKDEKQIDHAVAFVLSLDDSIKSSFNLNFDAHKKTDSDDKVPLALTLFAWLNTNESTLDIRSNKYRWQCSKHV